MKVPMRFTVFLFLVMVFCHVSFSYAEESDAPPVDAVPVKTIEDYRSEGITVVGSNQWKPFTFANEAGEYTGLLVELWRVWEEKTGVPVRLVFDNWPIALGLFKSGSADVLSGLYFSEERADFMEFSDPLHSTSVVLAIRDDADIDCSNALTEGLVGVVDQGYPHDFIKVNFPEGRTAAYPGAKAVIDSFLAAETEAVVINHPTLVMEAGAKGQLDGITICRTLFYEVVYAGVQKGDTALLEVVNDGFSQISQEELDEIKGRWFVTAEREYRWVGAVLPAIIVVVLMGGFVILWVRRV